MWNSDQLDLDAYLARTGYDGDRKPSLDNLGSLQRAHVLNLRWDTIDGYLYRRVRVDLPSIQDKMLRRGRGGYCFEHTLLFAAVLERFGYAFTAVSGRVQLGADSSAPRPATHAMVIVDLDDRRWLVDVGFGASPLEPIELVDGARSHGGPWPYLLRWQTITHGREGWAVHQRGEGAEGPPGWLVRQVFTENPQFPIDYAVGNHFVGSNENSPFVTRPYVQRLRLDRYDTLDALTWTTEYPDGQPQSRVVEPHEVPKLLNDVFDIRTDDTEAELLVARLTRWAAERA